MFGITKSVRATVVAAPLIVLALTTVFAVAVMSQIQRQQGDIFAEYQRLTDLQSEFSRVPLILSEIQNTLYEVSLLANADVTGPLNSTAIAEIGELITAISRHDFAAFGTLRPAFGSAIERYVSGAEQAVAVLERTPALNATIIRITARLYKSVARMAEEHQTAALAGVEDRMAVMEMRTRRMTERLGWVLAGMVVAMVGVAFYLSRLITVPIQGLTATVKALQQNRLGIFVPDTDRRDELGQVARAIESFRASLIENRALQKERDDLNRDLEAKVAARTAEVRRQKLALAQSQVARETDRMQITRQLRIQFGAVIRAASRGDFTRRVDTKVSDANLARLAGDVNRLIETVEPSLEAAKEAMEAVAQGRELPDRNHAFSGTFAEIMAHIDDTAAKILRQSERLKHIALHDTLTGLPNRRFLEERLDGLAEAIAQGRQGLALMHIDLDRFKQVNDTMGHHNGDLVLKKTAAILRQVAGPEDFVARVGGDEFILLGRYAIGAESEGAHCATHRRIDAMAGEILTRLAPPMSLEGGQARLGASVGIAFSGQARAHPNRLMVEADLALYEAKERGRNQSRVFTPHLKTSVMKRKSLGDDLHRALEEDEFVPYFQPQIDTRSDRLIGVEALVRWSHPKRGLVPPSEFVGTASEIGLLPALDRIVLEKSLAAMSRLNGDAASPVPRLSVNVGLDQLTDASYLETAAAARETGVAICFELLETILFDEQDDEFAFIIDGLQDRGFLIEVDDFGSGHASISSLVRCRPDGLKIDRTLVRSVIQDGRQERLVGSIIEMAHSLGIDVIAEGVETADHAAALLRLGAPVQQGYHFLQPVDEEKLAAWLTSGGRVAHVA